jgi:hypothetical protein
MQQRVDDRREKMESLLGRPHVQSLAELAHAQWTSRSFVSVLVNTSYWTPCPPEYLTPRPPEYILHRVLLITSYTVSS